MNAGRSSAAVTVVFLPQPQSWSLVLPPCLLKLTSSDITHRIHLRTEYCAGNKPSFPGFPDNSSAICATDTFWSHYLQFSSTVSSPLPLSTPGCITRSKDWMKQGKGKQGGCTCDRILQDESLNQ